MLEEIDGCIAPGKTFAFETTLAGRAYLRRIVAWRASGRHVTLYFLALPSAESAIDRVVERVRQGGHHVPSARRAPALRAGRRNFERLYRDAVDDWVVYDNAGDMPIPLK